MPEPAGTPVRPRRRGPLVVASLAVLVTGLVVSRGDSLVSDLAGGALYAALVQLLVLLAAPRVRARAAAATATACCVAVELAQLTPVPAHLSATWPPVAYVLGSTFVATDLAAYATGVAVVTAVDVAVRRARR